MRKDLERLENAQNSVRTTVPYDVARSFSIPHSMVTTAFELDGYKIVRTLGVVRGITVRSRSLIGNIGASLQTLVGGNITILTKLCEETRAEAFDIMVMHGSEIGANAIVGVRYDATEIMQGATEVLAYGTAVVVEPVAASITDSTEPRIP
jgi:uncharacterized protein YbjQ (UPF0145 family)